MIDILLFSVWFPFYFLVRKKISSGNIYFFFLLCMLLPASIGTLSTSWFHEVQFSNIIVFSICLIVGFLPWYTFDKNMQSIRIIITQKGAKALKKVFITLITLSLFSIVYLAPSAVISTLLGADETRALLYSGEYDLLPKSPLTTIAVAGSACWIYCVLFFFIASLTPSLKTYRIWLVISSFSYIVHCMAITARDGLILVPTLYLVCYLIFRNSLKKQITELIKRQLKFVFIAACTLLILFSLSRFSGDNKTTDWDRVYSGTVGYITQQPYVFDATIEGQNDFWGFECRFPLINRLIGIKEHDVNRRDNSFEWGFGTMYAEHYSAFGWLGLVLITLSFVGYYGIGISFLIKNKNIFGTLMLFIIYSFIVLSGMFYTRAGSSVSLNIFYFSLSTIPFFLPKYLTYARF